jgi:UDP-N-acetylmuramate--alanine ligase
MSSQTLYFFVGIGGIGMSALAEYMKQAGYDVCGSDKDLQHLITDHLKKKEIYIFSEEDSLDMLDYFYFLKFKHIILVRTNTVLDSHPLIKWALKKSVNIKYRAEILSECLKKKEIIGITGSHGKTSTTGLIGSLFIDAGIDPTIFIGGVLEKIKSNLYVGRSSIAVVEADDAYKSFLTLNPKIAVVTTISYEHLETYKNWDEIYRTFAEYTNRAEIKIVNYDSKEIKEWVNLYIKNPITYGSAFSGAMFTSRNIKMENNISSYDLYFKGFFLVTIKLPVISIPLIKNSMAAIIVGLEYNIPVDIIQKSLWHFQGVQRRLENVGLYKKKTSIMDDYGHHPIEIDIVFETLFKKFKGRLIVFFQPHKYTRTYHLWNDFLNVLKKYPIYALYVTDVFDAGDEIIPEYTSEVLVKTLNKKNIHYLSFHNIYEQVKNVLNSIDDLNEDDCILTLGAGKLNELALYLSKIK